MSKLDWAIRTLRFSLIALSTQYSSWFGSGIRGWKSAQVAYESNKLGQEVGVRTNLDVLNTQQNVFSARRDLASAYFGYLIGELRLKSAVGTLSEQDLEDINRRLAG